MTAPVDHTLEISYDQAPVDPCEVFGIRVYENPREADVSEEDFEKGRAFFLDKYEHSLIRWSLSGEGPQCLWDTSRFAGVLVFDDWRYKSEAASHSRLRSAAELFLRDYYTPYANGEVYFVCLDEDPCGEVYPADFEERLEAILSGLPKGRTVAVFGDAVNEWLQRDIEDILSKLGLKPVWGPCCPHCRKPLQQQHAPH